MAAEHPVIDESVYDSALSGGEFSDSGDSYTSDADMDIDGGANTRSQRTKKAPNTREEEKRRASGASAGSNTSKKSTTKPKPKSDGKSKKRKPRKDLARTPQEKLRRMLARVAHQYMKGKARMSVGFANTVSTALEEVAERIAVQAFEISRDNNIATINDRAIWGACGMVFSMIEKDKIPSGKTNALLKTIKATGARGSSKGQGKKGWSIYSLLKGRDKDTFITRTHGRFHSYLRNINSAKRVSKAAALEFALIMLCLTQDVCDACSACQSNAMKDTSKTLRKDSVPTAFAALGLGFVRVPVHGLRLKNDDGKAVTVLNNGQFIRGTTSVSPKSHPDLFETARTKRRRASAGSTKSKSSATSKSSAKRKSNAKRKSSANRRGSGTSKSSTKPKKARTAQKKK